MKNVIVEQCGECGLHMHGPEAVARCTNVVIRQNQYSGVFASSGAKITFVGENTSVHENSFAGESNEYGLRVSGSNSNISFAYPLTKELVVQSSLGRSTHFCVDTFVLILLRRTHIFNF